MVAPNKDKYDYKIMLILIPPTYFSLEEVSYHAWKLHIRIKVTHQIPSLKTVHRTVFLTLAFSPSWILWDKQKQSSYCYSVSVWLPQLGSNQWHHD